MYKLHLILKYLRKRRIAWVSLIAVMLCTAMVLVVISVMGGWLQMFRETHHGLVGDLIVSRNSLDGFGHYEELMQQIQALPEVRPDGVAAGIQTVGLVKIGDKFQNYASVEGWDLKQIQHVNDFDKGLYLQPDVLRQWAGHDRAFAKDLQAQAAQEMRLAGRNADSALTGAAEDQRAADNLLAEADALEAKATAFPSWDKPMPAQYYRDVLPNAKGDVSRWPGVIVGWAFCLPRDDQGKIIRPADMYGLRVLITVVGSDHDVQANLNNSTVIPCWIIDDSNTNVFPVDDHTVYLPFDVLQRNLKMDAQTYTDAATGQTRQQPARANLLEIRLKPGFSPDAVKPKVQQLVTQLTEKYPDTAFTFDSITTQTWEEHEGEIIMAVEHEEILLVILFAIISVVAIFLIFCIFFMIVIEKTRDIGIIKSVGASSTGIAAIFLGYGLTIGIVGGGLGFLLGYLVIHNINFLHGELAKLLGVRIWDAKTYVFSTIPDTVNPRDAIIIVAVAILSSVLGAVVPALRAAAMNPVEALRWE